MKHRPYLSASIDELERALGETREYAVLKALADELQHRSGPGAGKLRLKAGMAMARARKAGAGPCAPPPPPPPPSPPPSPPPGGSPLAVLLASFGLDAPDGRPLHQYRLGPERYGELQAYLTARAAQGSLDRGNGSSAALLVLWASAWFRREYAGGIRKYRELNQAIGASLADGEWRSLIEAGLRWWRRPLIERESGKHRLLTIAVEGGFPIRVLEAGEGWLSRYLNQVVGRLLAVDDPQEEDAFAFAQAARDELRDTYRQEAFIALAADVALAIAKLRREAESFQPGAKPSLVLDQIRPDWRAELPITSDTEAARAIVDGMLSAAKIARGLSGAAGCARVLKRNEQGWRTGLRLSLAGDMPGAALDGLAAPGVRLGVHPYGILAPAVGEELAFLDPPGEDGSSWRLRPLTRRTEVFGVPLTASVDVQIQAPNGAARLIRWPGGDPERSDVLSFEIDEEQDGEPVSLVLAARGSARLRASRVVVAAPADWGVVSGEEDGTAIAHLGVTDDGRSLWLAEGPVLITSTDGGLIYSIESGAEEELRDSIQLDGPAPRDFESADQSLLIAGRPRVCCYRGRTTVQPASNELLWRRSRSEPWRELARHPLGSGTVEVMWRDARTGFVRDRVRAAIVPAGLTVSRERDGNGWRYRFVGLDDLSVHADASDGLLVEQRSGTAFALSFRHTPSRRVHFLLDHPQGGRPTRISLPFPLQDGLAHWDGRLVPPGSVLTPADLAELVAFGDGQLKLCAELKHANIDVPAHYTLGDRELGLRPLASRIASDLSAAGIDAWVELNFFGAASRPYRIQPFDSSIRCEPGFATILHAPGLAGAALQIVGRSIAAPHAERVLVEPSLEEILNHRQVALPPDLRGAWLVYLRSGHLVRSRPTILFCGHAEPASGDGLSVAISIASGSQRRAAIGACLDRLCTAAETRADDLAWLHRQISSLNGVPAATFDVLAALPASPSSLALLLLAAPDESVQASVWRLETELPFLWSAIPLDAWKAAADALGRMTVEPLLSASFEPAAAAAIGCEVVSGAAERAGSLDSALASCLSAVGLIEGSGTAPTLVEAASGYVRRTFDRGETAIAMPTDRSLFRVGDLAQKLPSWFEDRFDRMHLEALDAPLAVAEAAKGLAKLSPAQLTRCKSARTEDPIYFAEGLAAALNHNQ